MGHSSAMPCRVSGFEIRISLRFRAYSRLQMTQSALPPHLIHSRGMKRCSVCLKAFPDDAKPSVSQAFRKHLDEEHSKRQPIPNPRLVSTRYQDSTGK